MDETIQETVEHLDFLLVVRMVGSNREYIFFE
jgi:hypothetical protein